MYALLRPLIFRLDPEQAHELTLKLLALPGASLVARLFAVEDARLAVSAFGLTFRNPVGLAAGYDKNGRALRGLAALGFGHLEAGTITRAAQPGNPRPRIFRLASDEALINRMGFPNEGARRLVEQAARGRSLGARLGINIGKSKETPLERAAEDYGELLGLAAAHADYVAINISSPNTPGLRQLQTKAYIRELLSRIAEVRASLQPAAAACPVLLKIAPDLTWAEIDDILEAAMAHGFDGLIATNTTLSREALQAPESLRAEAGGLSGQPLRARSTDIIRYIYRRTQGRLPLVGVGGIDGPAAALEKIRAGASLIQVYTGLVYQGPGLVKAINRALLETGANSVSELIGNSANGAAARA